MRAAKSTLAGWHRRNTLKLHGDDDSTKSHRTKNPRNSSGTLFSDIREAYRRDKCLL